MKLEPYKYYRFTSRDYSDVHVFIYTHTEVHGRYIYACGQDPKQACSVSYRLDHYIAAYMTFEEIVKHNNSVTI